MQHVPRDESRRAAAGRAMRQHVESQLRRASRQGRPHASGESGDGGGSGDRRAFRRRARMVESLKEIAMQKFKNFTGMVAPLDRANVDTDQIIPKQFLKAVVRAGMGKGLFIDWRRNPDGTENKDFSLNKARFQGASILVARKNFGCGSSREHAVWALEDAGFRAAIAPEFADIFHNNCLKNGFLPVTLTADEVEHIFRATGDYDAYRIENSSGNTTGY